MWNSEGYTSDINWGHGQQSQIMSCPPDYTRNGGEGTSVNNADSNWYGNVETNATQRTEIGVSGHMGKGESYNEWTPSTGAGKGNMGYSKGEDRLGAEGACTLEQPRGSYWENAGPHSYNQRIGQNESTKQSVAHEGHGKRERTSGRATYGNVGVYD